MVARDLFDNRAGDRVLFEMHQVNQQSKNIMSLRGCTCDTRIVYSCRSNC